MNKKIAVIDDDPYFLELWECFLDGLIVGFTDPQFFFMALSKGLQINDLSLIIVDQMVDKYSIGWDYFSRRIEDHLSSYAGTIVLTSSLDINKTDDKHSNKWYFFVDKANIFEWTQQFLKETHDSKQKQYFHQRGF